MPDEQSERPATGGEPTARDRAPEAGPATPDEATLARVAEQGHLRRAPRFGAFIGAGVLVGIVVGVVLATVFDTGALTDEGGVLPFLGGANGARAVTGFALGGFGALVGALLALWADARSRRRR